MSDGSHHDRVVVQSRSEAVVVTLPTEIDITNGKLVREAVAQALCEPAAVLVADAAGTAFCDCAGVSALTRAHHQAVAAQAQLRVVASPAVRRVIELTGASRFLSVYPNVAAALDIEQHPESPSACGDAAAG